MIYRHYQDKFNEYLKPNRVLIIYGPRRVGKTTLVEKYLKSTSLKYRLDSGDDLIFREILNSQSIEKIRDYAEGYKLIVIDEAQKINNIGNALKILVDHIKNIRVIATGSASFELANKIGEPLTGRKINKLLYPISQLELAKKYNRYDLKLNLENYLIFGSYPEILNNKNKVDKIELLNELVGSYLLRDILALERIKNPKLLLDLLKLLAFQIGKDVSLSELAANVGVDYKTVARYLDLLEKSFVIKSISGFSKNLRKEISKNNRYYFFDNGLRNAIISNFNTLDLRDDKGALWENFILMERIKRNEYLRQHCNLYYWRTYRQQEIDLIEEKDGFLHAYEFKFKKEKTKRPKEFLETYKKSSFEIIRQENYLDFILE